MDLSVRPGADKYHPKEVEFADRVFMVPCLSLEPDELEEKVLEAIDEYEKLSSKGTTRERFALEKAVVQKSLLLIYEKIPDKLGLDRPSWLRFLSQLLGHDLGKETGPTPE